MKETLPKPYFNLSHSPPPLQDNMAAHVKRENVDISTTEVISVTSTSHGAAENSDFNFSDDDTSAGEEFGVEINPKKKKQRIEAVLPVGFLDPIRSDDGTGAQSCIYKAIQVKEERVESSNGVAVAAENGNESLAVNSTSTTLAVARNCRQFWKAGDYDVDCGRVAEQVSLADMDHVRVHPRFLHSNATSHKWALGAFAELLDNALDEVCNGATYVSIDVLKNKEHNNKMVVIQDNGGGMTPDKMRQCMSLGYSAKSRMANTIGQYGNGFKTSTMRLGADVIVFSRCQGKYGGRTTQSIGMLSYTFLQNTGKEDIVVPMIDFEKVGQTWKQHVKSSQACWQKNLEIIVQWSPFQNEDDLLQQFDFLEDQGTRIIIYNLWEDDLGSPELDFDTDEHDIQIRGASRDEKKIAMAKSYPSCRHFLTYRHSLKSYASILYRRIPPGFRITLRGEDVDHHDIVDDLIHTTELVYKPAAYGDVALRDPNKQAEVTIGFVKDATHHIDVQGFNVYHKNRLIKPFWRVWNAAGSDGRGVIGVLEANFVEPAHDKQGFERTIALSRLEARLINLQKNYWSSNCHLIGYAQRRHSKKFTNSDHDASSGAKDKSSCKRNTKTNICKSTDANEHATPLAAFNAILLTNQIPKKARNQRVSSSLQAAAAAHVKIEEVKGDEPVMAHSANDVVEDGSITSNLVLKLKQENESLRNSLKNVMLEFQFEKDRNKSLQNEVDETNQKLEKLDREQEVFVGSFAEERNRRDEEELKMRKKLQEASATIKGLLDKLEILAATK